MKLPVGSHRFIEYFERKYILIKDIFYEEKTFNVFSLNLFLQFSFYNLLEKRRNFTFQIVKTYEENEIFSLETPI